MTLWRRRDTSELGIRHRQFWDKAAAWVVAVAVAVGVVGAGIGLWETNQTHEVVAQNKSLTKHLIVVGNRHHAETAAQNALIETLLTQVKTLLQQHSASFAQQQAYDADVLAFAQTIEGELTALCSVSAATCPALPTLTAGST